VDEREPLLIRLPHAIARDITKLAADNKRSRTKEIEVAIEKYLEHCAPPRPERQ
jgi:hypothetical protein